MSIRLHNNDRIGYTIENGQKIGPSIIQYVNGDIVSFSPRVGLKPKNCVGIVLKSEDTTADVVYFDEKGNVCSKESLNLLYKAIYNKTPDTSNHYICPISQKSVSKPYVTKCGHIFELKSLQNQTNETECECSYSRRHTIIICAVCRNSSYFCEIQ